MKSTPETKPDFAPPLVHFAGLSCDIASNKAATSPLCAPLVMLSIPTLASTPVSFRHTSSSAPPRMFLQLTFHPGSPDPPLSILSLTSFSLFLFSTSTNCVFQGRFSALAKISDEHPPFTDVHCPVTVIVKILSFPSGPTSPVSTPEHLTVVGSVAFESSSSKVAVESTFIHSVTDTPFNCHSGAADAPATDTAPKTNAATKTSPITRIRRDICSNSCLRIDKLPARSSSSRDAPASISMLSVTAVAPTTGQVRPSIE